MKIDRENLREDGFTLIEILVVILIIGILAAIAIPVFLNQRKTANDATVESDVRNAATAIETYFTNNPKATTITASELRENFTPSNNITLAIQGVANDFCIQGWHSNGKQYFGQATPWVDGKQPYYLYTSLKGGGAKVTAGVSGETCFPTTANNYPRFYLNGPTS